MTLPTPPNEPIAIGKYQILDLAGEGAMGSVYRARDTVLNRVVAIKVMNATIARDQSLRDRFLREAQSAGSLQHPNVVTIYDFGELDGHLFIAMEYVEGSDLETLLAKQQTLTLQTKLEIMIDVLAGLAYAHQHGIVHRDLKPANIRVTPEPRGKLMDFGVAHLESQKMTQTGVMIGTPNYMAPEYISGKPVTGASDIFSMGAVLYEVLTGRKPFLGDTLHALLFAVVQEEPVPPSQLVPGLPVALDAVVQRAMAKEPADRYESAIDMAQALTAVRASLSGAAYNESMALSQTLAHKVAAKGADVAREAVAREAAAVAGGRANRTVPPGASTSASSISSSSTPAASAPRNTRTLLFAGIAAVAALSAGGVALMKRSVVEASAEPATSAAQTAAGNAADAGAAGAAGNAPAGGGNDGRTNDSPTSAPASASGSATTPAPPARVASGAAAPTRSSNVPATPATGTAQPLPVGVASSGGNGGANGGGNASAHTAAGSPAVSAPVSPAPVSTPPVTEPTVTAPVTSAPASVSPSASASAPTGASAGEARSAQADLREIIARYARAISSRDIGAVRSAYPGITRDQQQGFERFFSSTKSLTASLLIGGLDVRDRAAEGRVTGTYEFIGGSGRKEVQMVSFRAQFERDGETWRLTSVR